MLDFRIHDENVAEVDLGSILIQGKIPPDDGYPYVENGVITTGCLLTRFLGVSGFRPIPPEGVKSTYTIEYDKIDGSHVVLEGDYYLGMWQGDVNLDGNVDIADVQFMADYFWNGGQICEFEEFMDIDQNGQVDVRDVRALINLIN